MINNLEEALKHKFSIPKNIEDHTDIYDIDGYSIAKDLGFDLNVWGEHQLTKFQTSNKWDLNFIECLLMFFYFGRLLHFTGYTYHEYDKEKETLLSHLSTLG